MSEQAKTALNQSSAPRTRSASVECGMGSGESASASPPVPHSSFPIPQSPFASTAVHLSALGLKKNYQKAAIEIPVLTGVDLEVRQGEFLAIVGQSGSGKSTLLHLLGTLDAPTAGEVYFLGKRIDNLPSHLRERLRNEQFGMIFQFYHLLPELTTLENVLAPLMIGRSAWSYWGRRRECLEPRHAALGNRGTGTSPEASAARTLWRRNAAGGHRPCLGRRPASAVGRRADRQSRSKHRSGNSPHLANLEP